MPPTVAKTLGLAGQPEASPGRGGEEIYRVGRALPLVTFLSTLALTSKTGILLTIFHF